jgi:hypothetical protein
VEIGRGAVRVVADPGCVSYTVDVAARDFCRSEHAHASLVVKDDPLAVPDGPFGWHSIAPTPDVLISDDGTCWSVTLSYARTAGEGRLRHERTVVLAREWGVLVFDRVQSTQQVSLALHWPLPHRTPRLGSNAVYLDEHGLAIQWHANSVDGAPAALDDMVFAPSYGSRSEGRLLRVLALCPAHLTLVTAFTESSCKVDVLRGTLGVACNLVRDGRVATVTLPPRGIPEMTVAVPTHHFA